MTQDVLLTISGLHDMVFADPEENEENEPIEVITPASYYWKNGKHYILYDEVMEGIPGVVKNKIKIVDHKQVLVNGKQVNIPSYLIKAGDVIEIKEGKKSSQRYKDIVEVTGGRLVPEWLESDIENLKGTVKELPTREAIDVPVDEMMIVELYSK